MATGLSVTACSTGPADLAVNSTDWKGVSGVLVTNVDHQRAVAGIDTSRKQARTLLVLRLHRANSHSRASDDVQGTTVLRRSGSTTDVSTPATTPGQMAVFRVSKGSAIATSLGSFHGTRALSPTATDGAHTPCPSDVHGSTAEVKLKNGHATRPVAAEGFAAASVACWRGRSLLAGPAANLSRNGDPTLALVKAATPRLVVGNGRVDQLMVTGDSALVLVGTAHGEVLIQLDLTSGHESKRVLVPGLAAADDFFSDASH